MAEDANQSLPHHWIDLQQELPSPWHPVVVNKYELCVATKENGLYKYNMLEKEWKQWKNYPKDYKVELPMTICDQQKKLVYVYGSKTGDLFTMNYDNNEHVLVSTSLKTFAGAEGFILDGNLHMIGGKNNNKHLVFNPKKQDFVPCYEFSQFKTGFGGFKLVKIRTMNVILLIGGYAPGIGGLNSIYSFSLLDHTWTKSHISLPQKICFFGCTITRNEQYVIVIGGALNGEDVLDTIYVMDMKDMSIRKSNIHCPTPTVYHVVIMSDYMKDQLIVSGFIRDCCNNISIRYPPDSVTKLLSSWYAEEQLYLVQLDDEDGYFWKINVDCILNRVKP